MCLSHVGVPVFLAGLILLSAIPAPAGELPGWMRQTPMPEPRFNPATSAKVELGRKLFFDPLLSGGNSQSCSSCHRPDYFWTDPRALSPGENGEARPRRTPSLQDVGWNRKFAWDGRVPSLEGFILGPVSHPGEMNQDLETLPEELSDAAGYPELFNRAFPGRGITLDGISMAIASFLRTLESGTSAFDRWVRGDRTAMSPDAREGFRLFRGKAGCAQCHKGWRFTDGGFHDTGLPGRDPGRGGFDKENPMMLRAFKTPALRNVAERPPYMHDGSLPDLMAVIRHYDAGFLSRPSLSPEMRKLHLSSNEMLKLIAFLETLSEE